MAETTTTPTGYVLSDDLMWISRITGTGRALGISLQSARSLEQLIEKVQSAAPRCIILDLGTGDLNPQAVVERIGAMTTPRPRFTAFGSHIDVAGLQAARDAGCDPVLPRSKMSDQLAELLQDWFR
jgi:CheY-like chemotaxis protein